MNRPSAKDIPNDAFQAERKLFQLEGMKSRKNKEKVMLQ